MVAVSEDTISAEALFLHGLGIIVFWDNIKATNCFCTQSIKIHNDNSSIFGFISSGIPYHMLFLPRASKCHMYKADPCVCVHERERDNGNQDFCASE